MVIVIGLWLTSLNFTIKKLNSKPEPAKVGYMEIFKKGSAVISKKIGAQISEGITYIKSKASETNSITIKTASFNAVTKGLEPIKPVKLP